MFLKVAPEIPNNSGLGQVVMRHPSGRMIRVRMPIALKMRKGVGQFAPVNGQPASGAKRNITSAAPTAQIFASAPGCNVVDLSKNECMLDDGTVTGCNIIQECDSLTGNQRCQYGPFPGQAADPSLPFCSGQGPSVSYTPNLALKNPTGPSTAFTPAAVFAANSGVVLPATSSARIAAPSSGGASVPATSPAAASTPASSVSSFISNLFGTATPAIPANVNIPVTGAASAGFFSESADILGVEIPYWLIAAAVVGGGLLLMGGKR